MKREEIIKHQFDGLTVEICDWEYLTPTVFLKNSVKGDIAEKEMVMAYLRAAELLYGGLVIESIVPYKDSAIQLDMYAVLIYLSSFT